MFDAPPQISNHPLMQDPAFAAALMLCGQTPITLPSGLVLLSRRIAGLPLLMLPRALPPTDLHTQLRQKGLHRRPLILSPETPCAPRGALRVGGTQQMWQLEISAPIAARRAALHQKWRNQLARAEDSPLRVRQRPLTPDHPLLALEVTQAHARQYHNWPRALTATFASASPRQTLVFTALLRGHEVAHMLFLTHGSRATYHIGHTTDAGRSAHAHNLLLWEATRRLAASGITRIDLGRATPTAPGLERFKARTGAQLIATGGTWLRWQPLARR